LFCYNEANDLSNKDVIFLNEENTTISQKTRLKQIIKVLNQHSFLTNFYRQKHPEEIRQALEELGPTFIKIGQLLSTRPDLVSPDYIKELRQLQDQVDVDSYATVEQTFEEQTGKRIEDVFQTFDQTPFASASIGQTHHATLFDGTKVVVKVQHPAVTQLVQTDLALFKRALGMAEHVPIDFSVIDPKRVLDELSTSLLHEIDTTTEVQNGQEFYRLNNGFDIIEVPKVYPQYCTQKILVNEAMPGKSIKHLMNEKMPSDEVSAAKSKNAITIWRMCWSKTLSSRFLRIISSMPIHIQATSCSTTCLKMIPSVMPWPMISTTKNSWAGTKSKFKKSIRCRPIAWSILISA
jgi:ubiquinone biosynthesis protein